MNIFEIVDREEHKGEYADIEPEQSSPIENDMDSEDEDKGSFIDRLSHRVKKTLKRDTKTEVESSWIRSLDFNHALGVCVLKLKSGQNYDINGMDSKTYYRWIKAPSKGVFFHRYVKGNYPIK